MNPLRTYRARSSWKPRIRFPQPGKPRSNRGITQRKKKGLVCLTHKTRKQENRTAAAGFQPKLGRRLNRIGKHWLNKPAVVLRGEREICNPATDAGRAEYKYRTMLLWIRQDGWCCFHEYDFCPGRLKLKDATFEHEGKRTKGQQDDRISYFDKAGKEQPMNGAAHGECNGIAGSRKLPIWHGTNVVYEKERTDAA